MRAIKKRQPDAEIRFWCDKRFFGHAQGIIHHFDSTIQVSAITSGKLRRYHNLPLWRQLIRPDIVLPNIRDVFLVGIGFVQSIAKLRAWKPDVVFTKGGFVCLPVGLAAKVLGIPLVIHDSDAHPGLTNRLLARFAASIATGAPLKYYNYPLEKSKYVGIPVADECQPFTVEEQHQAKKELGVDPKRPLVVITGGGLGAQRINDAVVEALHDLLPITSVILIAGSGQYDEILPLTPQDPASGFQLHAFVTPLVPMFGAADIVLTRAGATTLLELAAMAKPTILIPNQYLTGGHQLKNAKVYEEEDAAIIIDEDELERRPGLLVRAVGELLADPSRQKVLSKNIHRFAKPQASEDMADMILESAK